MEISRCQPKQQKVYSRKRKRMGIDCNVGPNKQNWSDNGGMDKLPDDILINIISHISLNESARASILARRWRYLWRFANGILRFDNRDTATGNAMGRKKFKSWVNTVVKLHQARYIQGMVISVNAGEHNDLIYPTTIRAVDSCVFLATQKEVQMFELSILNPSFYDTYVFPSVERLISHYHGIMSSPFCHLRTLRLASVNVEDEVVHYFLASCPSLEELGLQSSEATLHLKVIDPPSLRVLEISECSEMESVEISAVNLVSFTYGGGKISLVLKSIPNLRELTIHGSFCQSFVIEPEERWSFSVQLEKLVLDFRSMYYRGAIVGPTHLPQLCSLRRMELQIYTSPGRSLLFHTSLIEAAPQLCEFRIELSYSVFSPNLNDGRKPFSEEEEAEAVQFVHTNLKVVEMVGYIACSSEKELLLELFKIGRGSIERVVIDTDSDNYYDQRALKSYVGVTTRSAQNELRNKLLASGIEATTRDEAKMRAKDLALVLPNQAKLIVT